jgi:recombination protein RecR
MKQEAHMQYFPPALERLVEQFARLPGIGYKTAQRLAFFILAQPAEEVQSFADALTEAKSAVIKCPVCQNLTDGGLCSICSDEKRDRAVVCVVADPRDVIAFERMREYRGLYHVLHGVLSPMNHVGPDDLEIKSLLQHVAKGEVQEVIMATNPDTEGEATAMYLAKLLRPFEVKVTRLAYGIPVGSHLEYTDDATLMRALVGRQEV